MRLLRYLPIIIPIVVRFVRSPQGKAAINKLRNRRNGPDTAPR